MTMLFVYDHVFFFLCYAFQVTIKFYELTGIRHNITSAYHPQANGEVEKFNRTTQEAFLKCQEFSDKVKEADVDWHRKLNSILFAYRVRKQASTCISPFFMMYGREPIIPWEVEHDLGPLESENVPELSIDEVIERMYNLRVQVLDVTAANIKQAEKVQARAYNTKHARNAFAVGEKVWRMDPLWSTRLTVLRKGPKWVGPYEIVERKGGGNGNYVLKCLSGKNKGKINKSSCPSNHLKRYVIRNPDIPNCNTSESEYGSDNEDEARETSDVTSEIPVHTPVDSDDNTLPDLTVDEPPMPPHVCTPSVSSELPHVHTPSDEPPILPHVRTPSKLFPGCTPSSLIPPAHSDETMSTAKILMEVGNRLNQNQSQNMKSR